MNKIGNVEEVKEVEVVEEVVEVETVDYKQSIVNFLNKNTDFKDYSSYCIGLKKLNICNDMDNIRIFQLDEVKRDLLFSLNQVIDTVVSELKASTELDNSMLDLLKTFLIDTKKNINSNCGKLAKILERMEKCSAVQKQRFLKLKGYNNWNTPLSQFAPNKYEFKGFTNNSDVVLTTVGTDIQIEVLPLNFKCEPKNKHFYELSKIASDIVEKEVRKQLASVNGNDLSDIIVVQLAIEKSKKESSKDKAKLKRLKAYEDSKKVQY